MDDEDEDFDFQSFLPSLSSSNGNNTPLPMILNSPQSQSAISYRNFSRDSPQSISTPVIRPQYNNINNYQTHALNKTATTSDLNANIAATNAVAPALKIQKDAESIENVNNKGGGDNIQSMETTAQKDEQVLKIVQDAATLLINAKNAEKAAEKPKAILLYRKGLEKLLLAYNGVLLTITIQFLKHY